MKNKMEVILTIAITFIVIIAIATYLILLGPTGYQEITTAAILIVLIIFAVPILYGKAKNIKNGLPAKDERITGINHKAGYYGFIAAIWTAAFAPTLADILFGIEFEGSHVAASVVIVSGFVFAISYLYLARKGH
jgi:hypothetical protein